MTVVKRLLLVTLIITSFLVPMAEPASAAPVNDEELFVRYINDLRASKGIAPLKVSGDLRQVARNFASRMAASGGIYHNPDLVGQAPRAWMKLGENVGVGYDVRGLHDAFVNSPGHYRNLVDADFQYVGIGVVYSNNRMWVVENFMKASKSYVPTAVAPAGNPKAERVKEFVEIMESRGELNLKTKIATGS